MNLTALIAVPLIMMAEGYILVINHTNGTKTEIPIEEITDMEFREDNQTPDPGDKTKLDTPNMMVMPSGDDAYIVAWSKVSNAVSYSWQVDDGEVNTVTGTQITVNNLTYGDHTVKVWANPAEGSQYAPSDPRSATITGRLAVNVTVTSVDQTSVKASVSINTNGECMAGIVPATVGVLADQVDFVKNNADAQKVTFTSIPGDIKSLDFTGLTADTQYYIVVFLTAEPDKAKATKVVTSNNLTPGTKTSIFAPGVTATSGWVDVDKVGDLSAYGWDGQDNLMCWGCTISGMIQWWLNDYKTKTGHDFETAYPIPTTSKCYSTPIMDLYNDYYAHAAGGMFNSMKWFFRRVAVNSYDEFGKPLINESLPYWQGGFGGMTEEETQALMVVNNTSSQGYDIPEYDYNKLIDAKGKTEAEVAAIFSERIINDLREGPVAICIGASVGSSVHGISCWGADFEVLSDGSYKVSKLYIGENDPIAGNVRNGMNPATITYEPGCVKLEMATTGGPKELKTFFGLRGYQGK